MAWRSKYHARLAEAEARPELRLRQGTVPHSFLHLPRPKTASSGRENGFPHWRVAGLQLGAFSFTFGACYRKPSIRMNAEGRGLGE